MGNLTIKRHIGHLEDRHPDLIGKLQVDFLQNINGRFVRFRSEPMLKLIDLVALCNFEDSERVWNEGLRESRRSAFNSPVSR